MNRSTQNYNSRRRGEGFDIHSASGDRHMDFNTAGSPANVVPPPGLHQMAAMMTLQNFRHAPSTPPPLLLIAPRPVVLTEFSAGRPRGWACGRDCSDVSKDLGLKGKAKAKDFKC